MQLNQIPPDELIVGITGHRFLDNPEEITDLLNRAFDSIEQHYPNQKLHLLTPLAEGADRLAAQLFLDRPNAAFSAILPMPASKYLNDFQKKDSEQEFNHLIDKAEQVIELSEPADPSDVYLQVGDYILRHCELLLAVWDGLPAKGTGGTGDVVKMARERGLPVIWISTQELAQSESTIRFERFPQQEPPSDK